MSTPSTQSPRHSADPPEPSPDAVTTADLVLLCAFGPNPQTQRTFAELAAALIAAGFRAPATRHLIHSAGYLQSAGEGTYRLTR